MPSIVDQSPFTEHIANGVTTLFAYEFQLLSAADLVVEVDGVVVPASDFTLAGVGVQAGGTVDFDVAPVNGAAVLLKRDIVLERNIDYQTNGDLPADVLDLDINRLWQALQQQRASIDGAVRAPYPEAMPELQAAADRASKIAGFNASGEAVAFDIPTGVPVSSAAAVAWSQIGSGAVARTVDGKLLESFSVLDFGADPTGATDSTLALQTAIAEAKKLMLDRFNGPGISILFPNGTYLLSGTLTIDFSNVYLVGESPGGVILRAPSANFDLIHFDGSALALYSVGMLNIRTYTPGNATAGCHIRARRLINAFFNNIQCIGWYDGIVSDGCAKTVFSNLLLTQENRTAGTTFRYGIDFASTTNNNSDVHVSEFQISWNPSTFTNETAIRIQGADGIYFMGGHHQGAVLLSPAGVTCASVFWTGIYFDAAPTNHVVFSGTSAAYRNFKFVNCYMRDCAADGLLFNASSPISKVEVVATQFASNGTGIRCTTGVTDMTVSASIFDDNNAGNNAANGDIIVTSGEVTVGLCRFIGGGAAGTAIGLGASSADCIITNNSLASSNSAAKITNTGANNRIRGNTGFITKNFGQATINNPATSIVVNHGLSVTPSIGQIKVNLINDATPVARYWISNVTATQFTINVNATPTASATFVWAVDAE
jgi:hypothetical protein